MNLYLDIETIPSQSPEVHAAIAETITPPGNISKAETIAAWNAEKKPALVKDAIAKTSLDGTYGHIHTIGFAVNGSKPDCRYLADKYSPEFEADVLIEFFAAADEAGRGNPYPVCVVGHNIIGFDLRFIWQRAIILGVRVPGWFPRDPKPWGNEAFDTMLAWQPQRDKQISLDKLCRALGVPGKDDIDGSMVASLWEAGRSDDIARYCMDDVERTRSVHQRMAVAFGEAA